MAHIKCTAVEWDWREQVDVDWLNEAMKLVFNKTDLPSLKLIKDDSNGVDIGDSCAIIVSDLPVPGKAIKKVLTKWNELVEKKGGASSTDFITVKV